MRRRINESNCWGVESIVAPLDLTESDAGRSGEKSSMTSTTRPDTRYTRACTIAYARRCSHEQLISPFGAIPDFALKAQYTLSGRRPTGRWHQVCEVAV